LQESRDEERNRHQGCPRVAVPPGEAVDIVDG